jgi:threonine dehydratase
VSAPAHVPTRADIDRAALRIAPHIVRTPLVASAWLSELAGADVRLKLEIVQVTGSFKIRGAMNAVLRLKDARPDVRRVVTASAGNHGQAVALAASTAGLAARIFLPATAPAAKRDAIRRLGAEIIEASTYDEAEAMARRAGVEADAAFVSAYSHGDVIAGAATVALEMFADAPSLDAVVVPLGGGGLLSGTAIMARSLGRAVQVIGAEVEASPAFTGALAAGRIVTVDVGPTLADGLAGNMEPDSQTFDLVRAHVDRVTMVGEATLARAMRGLVRRERLIVEGAGAAGVGALMPGGLDLSGCTVGVILSGRNVDAEVIADLLAEG